MLSGPPLPLHNNLRLADLVALAGDSTGVGAWVRSGSRQAALHLICQGRSNRILVSSDLGRLLRWCQRIAVRAGPRPLVLDAELLLQWRTLQVITAMPYLPALERLKDQFPGLRVLPGSGLAVPIGAGSPEAVLAELLSGGIEVSGSRVVYRA